MTEIVSADRLKFDAILVDLMWNDFDLEWEYDGLDVLAGMFARGRREDVLLACQGHGFERAFLDEGSQHPLVKGVVLKGRQREALLAIRTVAAGRKFKDPMINSEITPPERSIGYFLSKSKRLARFAGVIASGRVTSYQEIARALHVAPATANRVPDAFRPMLEVRGEWRDVRGPNRQALIFQWCGENAHYILSWCRRNVEVLGVDPQVFSRRSRK
ncbi:response regulator transcription factor [Nocardioides immobilis]|uniref:response regulator transcription factor n=1 Tax=Nocardioides immobilis TaxID=2049295 RepID=UPI0011C3D4DB|nr:response regulator transcription factor [Nocardioides immobilis]